MCGLHWFNPLVWLAARRFQIAREQACDEGVIALGARPSEYARHLLEIARAMASRAAAPAATLAMARRSQLEGRLMSILTAERARRRGVMLPAATVSILLGGVIGLATVRPWGDPPTAADERPVRAVIRLGFVDESAVGPTYVEASSGVGYSDTGVPILGSIPILGSFFSNDARESIPTVGQVFSNVGGSLRAGTAMQQTQKGKNVFSGRIREVVRPEGREEIERVGYQNGDFMIRQKFDDGSRLTFRIHGDVEFDESGTAIARIIAETGSD